MVPFDASSSTDADGTIVSYEWDFGDGSDRVTTAAATVSHRYTVAGTYSARVVVTDDDAATAVAVVSIVVESNAAPVAVAAAGPDGSDPRVISFSSAGSHDPDGRIVSYRWDFGNGNGSQSANPSHLYQASGTYLATLTVTDDRGATDTVEVTVER